jgi:hypothetical protein
MESEIDGLSTARVEKKGLRFHKAYQHVTILAGCNVVLPESFPGLSLGGASEAHNQQTLNLPDRRIDCQWVVEVSRDCQVEWCCHSSSGRTRQCALMLG